MTTTTIAVTNTSSTSFTAKQGICVYKELNRGINTIEQKKDKKRFLTKGWGWQTQLKKRICKLNIFTCWNRRV